MELPTISHPAFLVSHEVLDDRSLQIILQERSRLGPEADPFDLGFTSSEIVPSSNDSIYQISWPVVVCFAVRGDPFPTGAPSTSTISEVGTESPFLGWVKSESHASPDYIAMMGGEFENLAQAPELRHWVTSCMEAHFDVAATAQPLVVRLSPADGR